MKKYAVLVEKGKKSYGASVPDLPGCNAVAKTRRGVLKFIREAIVLHINELREAGEPVPEPVTTCAVVEI